MLPRQRVQQLAGEVMMMMNISSRQSTSSKVSELINSSLSPSRWHPTNDRPRTVQLCMAERNKPARAAQSRVRQGICVPQTGRLGTKLHTSSRRCLHTLALVKNRQTRVDIVKSKSSNITHEWHALFSSLWSERSSRCPIFPCQQAKT